VKKFVTEFKEFITKGNLVEIAVAFILALYFAEVVNTFTKGIVLPFVAAIAGEPSFDDITIGIGDSELLIGTFANAVINFVLVGFVLFVVVKAYNGLKTRLGGGGDDDEETELELLKQIRDELRARG